VHAFNDSGFGNGADVAGGGSLSEANGEYDHGETMEGDSATEI
jgi:hypothetical protein